MTFYVYHCLINRKYSWVGIFVDFFFFSLTVHFLLQASTVSTVEYKVSSQKQGQPKIQQEVPPQDSPEDSQLKQCA